MKSQTCVLFRISTPPARSGFLVDSEPENNELGPLTAVATKSFRPPKIAELTLVPWNRFCLI